MTTILDSLRGLAVPVNNLQGLPGNPRVGDVEAVARSLERFGQRKPIVARKKDGVIVAGNHTWQAAKQLGWSEIAVVWTDDDDETMKAYALADNRTAELGSYDEVALLELIREVGEADPALLVDSGWLEDAVSDLIAKIDQGLPDAPPSDAAPAPPKVPKTKVGDVWVLGSHRVVCGDSTDVGVFDLLLNDQKADTVWTDPPYGVSYVGKTSEALTISNDRLSPAGLEDFLRASLGATFTKVKPGGVWYVAAPSGDLFYAFATVLKDLQVWRHTLVWVKDVFVMGRADYHYRHESIFYGWSPGGAHEWFGGRNKDTVIEVARPKANREHPTMKPIDLIVKCLDNSAPRGGIVLDPFGGSGSTLLACEYTGRKARLIELDPRYVDVICRRWQEFTGSQPILESTGESHSFLTDEDNA
jgi:site-specific DNA-methyltransferase (adenine-specific)